jgi:hypothetical protein
MALADALKRPDPKVMARGIDERLGKALKALEAANKGKCAEKPGVSDKTLALRITT